MLILFSMLNH